MTIYVSTLPSRPARRAGAMTCALWADDPAELLATADRLGIPKYFARGDGRQYFHVGRRTRAVAVGLGAVERRRAP